MYYVYVLRNQEGILYKGQTNDLQRRIEQHNADDGFASYTKTRGPWKLVYSEEFPTRAEARKRELYLKGSRGRTFLKNRISAMVNDL